MDPAQHVLSVADVPLHQGHMMLAVQAVHIAIGGEVPVFGGHVDGGLPVHQLLVAFAVLLQVLDGDKGQAKALCQFHQLGGAHHGAVLPHDLAAQSAGLQPRQAAQVHGGLGVALPLQHTVGLGQQGEHVPRAAEVLRAGVLGHAGHGGHGPLGGGDAGGGVDPVNGHGEGRLVIVRVLGDHLGNLQLLHKLRRHGHTDEALAVGGHKVDVFRGGELGRADKVALVLPVRVVGDQNDLARPQVGQGLLHRVELTHIPNPPCECRLKSMLS